MRIPATRTSFVIFLLSTVPAWAADYTAPQAYPSSACAVSGPNGKLELAGGATDLGNGDDSNAAFRGVGSLSFPLGCMFGAQVDGAVLDNGDTTGAGFIGHLFMRDPSSHLLGITASYQGADGDHVWRVGPEAELYLGNLSLEGWAGFEDADIHDDNFFAAIDAGYYFTEDFRVSVGWRHSFENDAAKISAEYLTSAFATPVSLFAEGTFGEDDYHSILGGVRFYFGGSSKSLIARHREDDPGPEFFDMFGDGKAAAPTGPTCTYGGVYPDCYPNPNT